MTFTEDLQPGRPADGNGLVLWVPAIADVNKPTISELTASGVVDLTYGLTPDGFSHDFTVNKIESGRYTSRQKVKYDGTISDTVIVKYVWEGTEEDVVRTTLTPGTRGFIVHRLAIPKVTAIAADQLVDVLPVQCSDQKKVPPTENTELQREQELNVIGTVGRDVKVVAGP